MTVWSSLIGAFGLLLALQSPVSAAEPDFRMAMAPKATLVDGGQAAVLRVTASCPVGAQLLESFVYVTQDGYSTQWGAVRVPCDGTKHTRWVRVTTLDFTLLPGDARVSGYMVLTSGESISPWRRLKLKTDS